MRDFLRPRYHAHLIQRSNFRRESTMYAKYLAVDDLQCGMREGTEWMLSKAASDGMLLKKGCHSQPPDLDNQRLHSNAAKHSHCHTSVGIHLIRKECKRQHSTSGIIRQRCGCRIGYCMKKLLGDLP